MSPPPAFTKSIFSLRHGLLLRAVMRFASYSQFLLEPLNLICEGTSSVHMALLTCSNGDTVALNCNMNGYESWVKGQASCPIQGCFSSCHIFRIRVHLLLEANREVISFSRAS